MILLNFLKRLFCRHYYILFKKVNCIYFSNACEKRVPIYLLQCTKCGKRKIIKEEDFYYNGHILKTVEMWKKESGTLEAIEEFLYS